MWEYLGKINIFLEGLRLKLNEKKVNIYPVEKGVKFLGYKVYPYYIKLKRENIKRFMKRMRWYKKLYKRGDMELEKIRQSVMSWIGYAKFGNSYRIRREIFRRIFYMGPG